MKSLEMNKVGSSDHLLYESSRDELCCERWNETEAQDGGWTVVVVVVLCRLREEEEGGFRRSFVSQRLYCVVAAARNF